LPPPRGRFGMKRAPLLFAALTLAALLLAAVASPRAACSAAALSAAVMLVLRLGRIGDLWARVLLVVVAADAAANLLARLPLATTTQWLLLLPLLVVLAVVGFSLFRQPLAAPLRRLVTWGALAVALLALGGWAPAFLSGKPKGVIAELHRRHPTRALPALTVSAGDWRKTAASLDPLRAAGPDVYREALNLARLDRLPLAHLVLLGDGLRLAGGNPCVSLDYSPAREELAVLRQDGELLLYRPERRIIQLFTGDFTRASRVRATPDGKGFLCLFEHGETRYFGAPSPWAATGELKYGMGRVVDLAFLENGKLLALNAVGALYRIGSGTGFTEVAPPLFPGADMARGLALRDGARWILDMHGALHGPNGTVRFKRHAFPPPADDAVALRTEGETLYWLDAWGGLHGCARHDGKARAFGDLADRNRRGGCVDFAFVPWADRFLVLDQFGELASYGAARYAKEPSLELQP